MSSDFLRRELEAESRAAAKSRRIGFAVGFVLLLSVASGAFFAVQNRSKGDKAVNIQNVSENSKQPTKNASNTIATEKQTSPISTSQTPAPTTPAQSNQSQTVVVPLPQPSGVVDRTAFINNAHQVLSTYGQITDLVNFSGVTSDAVKASRITQAMALDSQSSSQVTSLRGLLVTAGVSSGKYMDLTNLEESGVSKVHVGLVFMNYWVKDPSRTSDLNSGLGGVGQGAQLLLQLSDSVSAL